MSKPLRLWPGVAIAALIIAIGYVVPMVVPDQAILILLAPRSSFSGGCSSAARAGTSVSVRSS